ncbi:hypothetical protein [Anaerotignum lactatifermentans]|uniref:hypothetical protein n=1 Tax=Anaerotignum lactatifermentans TaxID=160404 RepID=UPI003AB3CFF7
MPHIDVVPPFIYVKKHIYPHFTLAQNGEKAKAFPQRNAADYRKTKFYTFSRTRKGLGNKGFNTFAPQMPAINGCPHLLRCGFPNWNPMGKSQSFKAFADGTLHPEENGGSEADFAEQSA